MRARPGTFRAIGAGPGVPVRACGDRCAECMIDVEITSCWTRPGPSVSRLAPARGLLGEEEVFMSALLLIVVLLLVLGALPAWPYSREWGYYPSGGLGLLLLILII